MSYAQITGPTGKSETYYNVDVERARQTCADTIRDLPRKIYHDLQSVRAGVESDVLDDIIGRVLAVVLPELDRFGEIADCATSLLIEDASEIRDLTESLQSFTTLVAGRAAYLQEQTSGTYGDSRATFAATCVANKVAGWLQADCERYIV